MPMQGLDAESLVKSLEAVLKPYGFSIQKDGDGMDDADVLDGMGRGGDDNRISGWNERKIKTKGVDDRPTLIDQDYLEPQEQAMQNATERQKGKDMDMKYLDPDYDAGLDDFHPPGSP